MAGTPGARLVDLAVTKTAWVTTVAAFPAMTAVEANAGIDLTPYLLTDYSVSMDAAKTVNQVGIGDTADINVPTIATYKGSLHWFRSIIAATGMLGSDDLSLTACLGLGTTGYFVRRTGLAKTATFMTGQTVEAYKFIMDNNQYSGGQGTGFLTATTPLVSIGVYATSITLT